MNPRITLLFPAVCLMIMLSMATAQGQVEIRDSVSMSTMMDTTNGIGARSSLKSTGVKGPPGGTVRGTSSAGPWKRVDASISLPEGGGITVTVVDGNAGASLDLVIRSPFYKVLVKNANAHHGFTWDTAGFPAGTTFNIGINWYYWSLSGSERGCNVQHVNDSTYILGFEDRGIPPLYVDLIVKVVMGHGNGEVMLSVSADPSEVRPLKTGGNSRTTISVTALRDGGPAGGIPIELHAKGIEGSGGHMHHGNRPVGTFSRASGATGSDGRFVATYTASELGGIERIIASSSQAEDEDSVDVRVKVNGLVELAMGEGYELVGTPDNYGQTNDPCRGTAPTSLHYSNHFGTPQLVSAIRRIATSYGVLHSRIRIRVNDMSLVDGGLFDSHNNWRTPHGEHRVGKNADIGFTGITQDGVCVSFSKQDLFLIIKNLTKGLPFIEGDHYHIRE